MLDKKILDILVDISIQNGKIKTCQLNELGINNNQIKKLIDSNILSHICHGYYDVTDGSAYFLRAQELVHSRNFHDALPYFEKSQQLNYEVCSCYFQMFITAVIQENYQAAATYLTKLSHHEDQQTNYAKANNQAFFTLLNNLCFLDEESLELSKLPYQPISIKDNSILVEKEKIRQQILARNFDKAYSILEDKFLYGYFHVDKHIFALKQLLVANQKRLRIERNQLLYYYHQKDYPTIVELLNYKNSQCGLSLDEKAILEASNKYCDILQNLPLEKQGNKEEEPLLASIKNNSFEEALEMAKERIPHCYILHDILSDIIELPEKLKQEVEPTDSKKQILDSMIYAFQDKKYKTGINKLKSFLNEINKSSYESIAIRSLKFSLLEEDPEFNTFHETISNVILDEPSFSIPEHIVGFYQYWHSDCAKSMLHLEQIMDLTNFGYPCDMIPLLKKTLAIGKMVDYRSAQMKLEHLDTYIQNDYENTTEKISTTKAKTGLERWQKRYGK